MIIRRGPSKRVCTIGWDRLTDTFEVGQWIKGRIYERRCDISPDGKFLIYSALNGKWKSEAKGAWTAVSIAPYLRAVGLWAQGNTWGGGGLFADARSYWVNSGDAYCVREPAGLRQLSESPLAWRTAHFPYGYYFARLERDGGRLVRNAPRGCDQPMAVLEKAVSNGWILRKLIDSREPDSAVGRHHADTHELWNRQTSNQIYCGDWEWADIDRSRLVWVIKGKLLAGTLSEHGLAGVTVLHDFNPMTFGPLAAPYDHKGRGDDGKSLLPDGTNAKRRR